VEHCGTCLSRPSFSPARSLTHFFLSFSLQDYEAPKEAAPAGK
jgi:hypothetical protein